MPEILGYRSKRGAATAPFFFWRSQRSRVAVRFDLVGIGMPSFRTESMRRRFGLYAAFSLCVFGIPATAARSVLNDGHLSNQGTSFWRCHLSGPFRSMIEPQHRNSHFFVIKRRNMLRSCLYRSMVHSPADIRLSCFHPEDRRPIWSDGLDATLGRRTGLHIFEIARRSGGTCLVPKGQGSRGCEIGSLLFPQRSGCEYANDQSHGH